MSEKREWYLPDRQALEAKGPFSDAEIVEKIRAGLIRIDEYIWATHFREVRWRRVYELEEFRGLLATYPKSPPPNRSRGRQVMRKMDPATAQALTQQGGNAYRRFPRAPLVAEVIMHNHKTYRRGESIDISENGTSITMNDLQTFEKGEEVIVTLRNIPGIGTIAVSAAIVRIVINESLRGYGVSFLRLNPQIRRRICRYILDAALRAESSGQKPESEAVPLEHQASDPSLAPKGPSAA
jgi:hypothetical protein